MPVRVCNADTKNCISTLQQWAAIVSGTGKEISLIFPCAKQTLNSIFQIESMRKLGDPLLCLGNTTQYSQLYWARQTQAWLPWTPSTVLNWRNLMISYTQTRTGLNQARFRVCARCSALRLKPRTTADPKNSGFSAPTTSDPQTQV